MTRPRNALFHVAVFNVAPTLFYHATPEQRGGSSQGCETVKCGARVTPSPMRDRT